MAPPSRTRRRCGLRARPDHELLRPSGPAGDRAGDGLGGIAGRARCRRETVRCRRRLRAAIQDGTLAAYIGLGLVELDPSGGVVVLRAARRVLLDGGLIYLTVPLLNRRRKRSGTAVWRGRRVPAFSIEAASALLTAAGFAVAGTRPSSLASGFGRFGRAAARLLPSMIGREDEPTMAYRVLAPLLKPYANSLLIIGRKLPGRSG